MVGLLKKLRASHLKQGQEEQGLTASKTKTPLDTKKIRLGRDYDGIDDLKSQSLGENWRHSKVVGRHHVN
jgi:hypothetical protein